MVPTRPWWRMIAASSWCARWTHPRRDRKSDLEDAGAAAGRGAAPAGPGPGRDRTLPLIDDLAPMVRQRVAAYAVVLSTRGLLATQFSAVTAVPVAGECPAAVLMIRTACRGGAPRGDRGDFPDDRSWETSPSYRPPIGSVEIRKERSKTSMPSGWSIAAAVSRPATRSS